MTWFNLTGDARLGRCASEDCGGQPTWRFEADGIGSNYCSGCKARIIDALAPRSEVQSELANWSWGMDYGKDLLADINQLAHAKGTTALLRDGLQRAYSEIARLRKGSEPVAQASGNPSREAIATIIAGDIYGTPDGWVGPATRSARADGLKKADEIIALSPAQAAAQPVCDLCDAPLMCAACGHEQRPGHAQASQDAARMRRAILGYLSTWDACGGSESVSLERFADPRHALREAVAEVPEPFNVGAYIDDNTEDL